LFAGAFTERWSLISRSGYTLYTLATKRNDRATPSGWTTFDLAGRRASLGLAACLGHGAKMVRLRFYNRRSRHEHSMSTPPLETARRLREEEHLAALPDPTSTSQVDPR
jgi:hypothetical protein